MPEVLTDTNHGSSIYPIKRSAQRKGMGNIRHVKARLGPAGEAVVVDLSESGIGLELTMPLQPGSTLAVDFDLPESGGHVRVDGRVVWFGAGKRAGIRFERVPDLASERLKRWVSLGRTPVHPTSLENSVSAPVGVTGENSAFEADESLTLDRAVVQVLARAMAITKAGGAAIAIGPPEAMVCRASAGNAPDVGVPINPSSGLTGYCVRSRATVRCDDTETDERVNAAACREMELRSALVIPVFSGRNADELSGILEVFSSQPRAFSSDHIAKLEKLTKILGVVAADLVPGAEIKSDPQTTIAPVMNTETVVSESSIESRPERAHLPRKIGDRPSAGPPASASIAGPANGRSTRPLEAGSSTQRKVDPQAVGQVKPAALAAPVITSQIAAKETAVKLAELTKPNTPTSTTEDSVEEIKASPRKFSAVPSAVLPTETAVLELPSFAVQSPSLAEQTREWLTGGRNQRTQIGRALRIVGAVVIALEIAAALFLYTRWEKKRAALVQSSRPAAVSAPATPAVVQPAATLLTGSPAPGPVPKHKKQNTETLLPEDGSDDVIVVNRTGETGPPNGGVSATSAQPGSSKPTVTTESEPPAPAPIVGQTDLAAIRLPDNSVQPSLAVRMSSGTIGGKLIKRVEPQYPEAAKARRIQGQVLLGARVGTDGTVKQVHLLKGNPFLGAAAIEAIKHWRYEPMKLNGAPVEMDTNVMVQFKLPN
jgi:TonB family protein